MGNKKICLLVDSNFFPDQEGPSIIHNLLSEILVKKGYEVNIVHFIRNNTTLNFFQYQIYKISSGIHILNNYYDLIITPHWLDQTASRYILRYVSKKPYILMIHGSDLFQEVLPKLEKGSFLKRIYSAFIKGSYKTILDGSCGIISTQEIFNYLKQFQINEEKLHLLNFIYKSTRYEVNVSNYPWEKKGLFHILFYGRFHESKGILQLVKAVPKLMEHNQNFILHLVGDGPLKEEAQKIVSELGLTQKVLFHGRVNHEKIASYIMASDCIVNPVTWGAGPGTVALEVLSQRKPLILGNANVTIYNIHQNYGCFLIVDPQDPDDIASKIITIMDDPLIESKLCDKIERFIDEECDESKIGDKLSKIIDKSINYSENIPSRL